MAYSNYYRAKLILESNKKRWLKVNPNLPDRSGIYILTRVDENGIKYCYVGQSVKILSRLAQHLTQYQHIDLSLKKHKLYDEVKNRYGWNVDYFECLENELDAYEKEYILKYANMSYQMRNKTAGMQGVGKQGIAENKPSKGYFDGVAYGRQQMLKEVKEYFDKYLEYRIKDLPSSYRKPKNKAEKEEGLSFYKEIYRKKFEEFEELLNGRNEDESTN